MADAERVLDDAADPHVTAAREILDALAAALPGAGLGVTGSVGSGTHRPDSDVDLVAVDGAFRREMQFATEAGGIRAAVVCLRPELSPERERRWTLAAGGDVRLVAMVRSARVVRDPAGALRGLQSAVARLDAERLARRGELLAACREQAAALVRALDTAPADRREQHLVRLFTRLVDGWYLREGRVCDSKDRCRDTLRMVEETDPALAGLLRGALPVTAASAEPILRAFDRVFADAD